MSQQPKAYRIGERLRPCPGCPGCQPGPSHRQVFKWVYGRIKKLPITRPAYWLRGDADVGDDYCRDCITALPMMPGLVVASLLWVLGRVDECRSAARQIAKDARGARDGGWAQERDSWITCEGCGDDLEFNPTDYFIESELEHWSSARPESSRQWWEFLTVLDNVHTDERWKHIIGLLARWGCDGSGVVPARPRP